MRSKWSAESILNTLAVTSMEAAWLMLVYIAGQWLNAQPYLPMNILHFALAVALGISVAWFFQEAGQALYAGGIALAAVAMIVVGGIVAGVPAPDPGAFVHELFVNPPIWLLGVAVVRGAMQADPATSYGTERVFGLVIPGLVVYWILAGVAGLTSNTSFTTAAFAATLTFVSAGLVALGLARLTELDVESADRAARRRWIGLLVAVVGVVLIVGLPLAALLGLPIGSVLAGVLGPLGPIVFAVLAALATLLYGVLQAFAGLLGNPSAAPLPSIAVPSPIGGAPPPITIPDQGAPPLVLDWLFIAFLIVGFVLLIRLLARVLYRPSGRLAATEDDEVRTSEQIVLPRLPSLPSLHLRSTRRRAPETASQAYVFALDALAAGPLARRTFETPREHAVRLRTTEYGRDLGRLATDYQLDEFARRRLTAPEVRRAIARWRRIATRARAKP